VVPLASLDAATLKLHCIGLKELNEWPTFPQLIVNNEFVGGLDIIKEMVSSGEFAEVVKDAINTKTG